MTRVSLIWLLTAVTQSVLAQEGTVPPAATPAPLRDSAFPALEPSPAAPTAPADRRAPPTQSAFQELPTPSAAATDGDLRTSSSGQRPGAAALGLPQPATSPEGTPPRLLDGDQPPESAAKLLIRQALEPPAEEALPGTPLTLRAALERVSGPQQLSVVVAYWRLSHALASYHFALDEWRAGSRVPAPPAERQRGLVKAVQASAKAQVVEARLAALEAQHSLADAAQLPGDVLPLTQDPPLVGPYRTYFETLSARGVVPARLQRLDRTLPLQRALLEVQAEAVQASEQALAEADAASQAGPGAAGAESLERWRTARRKFLTAVRDYNETIAHYAVAVGGSGGVTPDRLVSMLVEQPLAGRSVLKSKRDSAVQRVSGEARSGTPVER
jgi:hypothetical protein